MNQITVDRTQMRAARSLPAISRQSKRHAIFILFFYFCMLFYGCLFGKPYGETHMCRCSWYVIVLF